MQSTSAPELGRRDEGPLLRDVLLLPHRAVEALVCVCKRQVRKDQACVEIHPVRAVVWLLIHAR